MNNPQPKTLLYLGIISLIIIAVIVVSGTLKGRYSFFLKKGDNSIVLGIADKLPFANISTQSLEKTLEGALDSGKHTISQKVGEAEGKLKTSLEKEISELTSAQIKSIKMKICQDWGVIEPKSEVIKE